MSELYEKYAPRWFKVIRWKEWADRTVRRQKIYAFTIYVPCYLFFFDRSRYIDRLCKYKPKTEEERMKLKRAYGSSDYTKNWKIDQYYAGQPPMYDVFERRQAYPQYYGDKYNNRFKMEDAGII